jgi:hypothetical protein
VVLLQALTRRRTLQGSATLLPTPFDGIIRNGLSGKWGLAEMAAALGPVKPSQVAAATAKPDPKPTSQQETKPVSAPVAKVEAKPVLESKPAPEVKAAPETKAAQGPSAPAVKTDPESVAKALASAPVTRPVVSVQAPDVRHRIVRPVEADPRRTRFWIVGAVGLVLLLFLFWRMMRSEPSNGANAAAQPVTTLAAPQPDENAAKPTATVAAKPTPTVAAKPTPTVAAKPTAAVNTTSNAAPLGGRTQWRVVAYTFNHEDQAKQKADSLAKRDPSLNPEVFTPNGRAPYLVTVGGTMTREQAQAFKKKAQGAGLPRDLYAQNYAH